MNLGMGLYLSWVMTTGTATSEQIRLVFSLLYAVNMYFQSYGAVSIVKVNAHWFHVRERGGFSRHLRHHDLHRHLLRLRLGRAIVDATRRPGAGESRLLSGALPRPVSVMAPARRQDQTWWVFFIPALVAVRLRRPGYLVAAGHAAQAPGYRTSTRPDASSGGRRGPISLLTVLKKILTNPIILTIALIEFCSGVIRNGIMHWYPIYAKEMGLSRGLLLPRALGLILCLAGISGGMFAGFISDKVFGSRRGPVAALLYGMMTVLHRGDDLHRSRLDFVLGSRWSPSCRWP